MIVRPSSSYQLQLPDEIVEDVDGRVISLWLENQPLLLQFSSYRRTEGFQVPAHQRLTERMTTAGVAWSLLDLRLCPDPEVDQAFAEQVDGENVWLHCYFVWPHLAIYATVIGPVGEMHAFDSWAHKGLRTLELVAQ